jgi:two-component system response regulator AtoC
VIKVLAVDDEEPFRRLLKKELTRKGFSLETASDGLGALKMLDEGAYDVVLIDIIMPGMNGIELMKKIRALPSPPQVIVLTGKATVETAVEAMKHGAYDYITKPFKLNEVEIVLHRAYEFDRLSRKSEVLEQELIRQESRMEFVGDSSEMEEIKKVILKVAPSDSTVLILGESGTGKELVANSIWQHSKRSDAPFTALNCATLSGQLIESELFGHEKGAFTTAYKTKYGIVEAVNNGTLLLDEIGELPLELQAKLLRFMDSGEFRRVGGNKTYTMDVRVIAATNRNLSKLVKEGNFRQDLYYRLNVINLTVPPLRERMADLPPLVELFIKRYSQKLIKAVKGISKDAMLRLKEYEWPGNVRELENVIERMVILCDGNTIGLEDISRHMDSGAVHINKDSGGEADDFPHLQDMEKSYIRRVLKDTGGNQTKASEILGINRKTLYLKLKKYGLNDD